MSDLVEIILRLRGARQFVGEMGQSTKSVQKLGTSAEDTGKKTKTSWKQLGKFAASSAAVAGAGALLKSSADATVDLAKNTMVLQRATGMDAKTGSEWVSVLKTRGVDTKQFQVGMTKLSKTMEAARGGNDKASASLAKLGISQDMIAKGDINGALMRSADAFALMKNPAEKAATAQALFGKSGQKLVPMLSAGSSGLQESLDMADKYGATLDTKGVGSVKEMVARQRELKLAQEGVKVQLGTALLPVMLSFSAIIQKVVQFMAPLLKNSMALQIVIGVLAAAFLVYQGAVIVSTLATLSFNASLLLIPLAVLAIIAGVVILYNKWGWFHRAVDNTFQWIKSHWPLLIAILTGPFGLAALVIIKNFGKIKSAVTDTWNWIKSTFGKIKGFVQHVFSFDFVKGIGRGIADWLNANTPFGDKIEFSVLGKHVGFKIPALAMGGTVMGGGAAVVGEAGPEIVRLPRAAQVIPNTAIAGAMGPQTIVTQVFLDKRQIAEAVGTYASDRIARR